MNTRALLLAPLLLLILLTFFRGRRPPRRRHDHFDLLPPRRQRPTDQPVHRPIHLAVRRPAPLPPRSQRLRLPEADRAGTDAFGYERKALTQYLHQIGEELPPYAGVSGDFSPSRRLDLRAPYVAQARHGKYVLLEQPTPTPSLELQRFDASVK